MKRVCLVAVAALFAAVHGPVRAGAQPPSAPVNPDSHVLAGTRAEAFSTIQGNVLASSNGGLAGVTVRLRDARSGRIADVIVTDKAGRFMFRKVSPGAYVVELVGSDENVLAASGLLNVNAGETASAFLRLPFGTPTGSGLGKSVTAAAIITATAAATGVLATRVVGTDVSPRQ